MTHSHRTAFPGPKPVWLTLDCYGMLVQLDEALLAAVRDILKRNGASELDPDHVLDVCDRHEEILEHGPTHLSFREVGAKALQRAFAELQVPYAPGDEDRLLNTFSDARPFPDAVQGLAALRGLGFRLCVITNSDDTIIAPCIERLEGHIERVITAEQARCYKPHRRIFDHAHAELGLTYRDVLHVTASPRFDLTAARDIGFRCAFVDRSHGCKLLPDYMPDLTVSSLSELAVQLQEIEWQ